MLPNHLGKSYLEKISTALETTKDSVFDNFHENLAQQSILNNLDLTDPDKDYFAYLDPIHEELSKTLISELLWYQAIFYNEYDGDITWVFIFKPIDPILAEEVMDNEQNILEIFESVFPLDPDASLIAPKISTVGNGTWSIMVPATV